MQLQRAVDAVLVDVLLDAPVGVAGDVVQHRAPRRALGETLQRHHREHLVDCPDVGQRLEDRQVAEVLVGQGIDQLVERLAVRRHRRVQACDQARAHRVDQTLGQRPLGQVEQPVVEHGAHFVEPVTDIVVGLEERTALDRFQALPQVVQHRGIVLVRCRRRREIDRAGHVDDVGHQHRVVGGQRAARFRDQQRMWQGLLVADPGERVDHAVGVLLQAVVDRAGAARAGSLVVDAEPTTDVDAGDRYTELVQLGVEAGHLVESLVDVADVTDL